MLCPCCGSAVVVLKPANGSGHQLHATELRHVGFNVCRIEPLLRNVQFQQLYQFTGDIVHARLCKFVIAKQFDVTLNRAAAQALLFRVQIQCILRINVEHVCIGGFLVIPVAELHDEQQASHGIELFGRPPHLWIKVFGRLSCGHQLQNGLPKDMLRVACESSISDRRKNVGKDIKQLTLSRIFQIPYGVAPSAELQRNDSARQRLTPGQHNAFFQFYLATFVACVRATYARAASVPKT